jgi:integrase/recombinase XerD
MRRSGGAAPSPRVADLADDYLVWLKTQNRSKQTIDYYGFAFRKLGEYIASGEGDVLAGGWDRRAADRFVLWLQEGGLKPPTVKAYACALKTLFRWAQAQERMPDDPLARWKAPSGKASDVRGYTSAEIAALLAACPDTPLGRRNRAIIIFIYEAGLRASELCALTIGDTNLAKGTALVRHGKGDRARQAVFSEAVAADLQHYLAHGHPDRANPLAPLFPAKDGTPLTRWGLRSLVNRLAKAAGVTGPRLGPHRLRHSCGEQAIAATGSNTIFVRDLLGHSDLKSTQRYAKLDTNAVLRLRQQTSVAASLVTAAAAARVRRAGPEPGAA